MSLQELVTKEVSNGKLGRSGVVKDPRTLRLKDYIAGAYKPPTEAHHSHVVRDWGMLLNDQLGDCVPVGALHADELWNAVAKNSVPKYTDKDALELYRKYFGYVDGDPSTDNGGYLLDMMRAWRNDGLPGTGNTLGAYASVDPTSATQLKTSIWEFGATYIGLNLPISAQDQSHWDVPSTGTRGDGTPGSWGGHCVITASYDSKYIALITWGGVKLCTWRFLGTYCDEAYAILSSSQLHNGASNLGLNYTQLKADLRSI